MGRMNNIQVCIGTVTRKFQKLADTCPEILDDKNIDTVLEVVEAFSGLVCAISGGNSDNVRKVNNHLLDKLLNHK